MKNKILILIMLLIFVLSGCSKEKPSIVDNENNIETNKGNENQGTEVEEKIYEKIEYIIQNPDIDNSESNEIFEVLNKHLIANETEDVLAVADTIMKELIDDEYKKMLKNTFLNYSLSYKYKDVRVITLENDEAKVQVVQETTSKEESDFKNNRVSSIISLYKIDGKWKIGESEVINIEYI